ncbi:Ras GTPase activating protein ira2 [Microbotryomycetes sp. JL201]|nr:Ras GTPase activating protein ira2 [Microbotryomycetes sp. JL201]
MADPPQNKLVKKSFFARARPEWSRKSLSGDEHAQAAAHQSESASLARRADDRLRNDRFDNLPAPPRLPGLHHAHEQASGSINSSGRQLNRPQLPQYRNGAHPDTLAHDQPAELPSTAVLDALMRRFSSQVRALIVARMSLMGLPHIDLRHETQAQDRADALETQKAILDYASQGSVEPVVLLLTKQIETLAKPLDEGLVSLDVLRSQALLLCTLAAGMFRNWAGNQPQSSAATKLQPEISDPEPLTERLALQVLALAAGFLRNNLSSNNVEYHRPTMLQLAIDSSFVPVSRFCLERLRQATTAGTAVVPDIKTRNCARSDIAKSAFQVLFYLSASNWTTVHAFIVNKIASMSKKDSGVDSSDIKILEGCLLTRLRLSMIVQDLSVTFSSIKKHFQPRVCTALYCAIRTYIDAFPRSFSAMQHDHRRMEGGPDHLFDIVHGALDKSKEDYAPHMPTLASLLVLTPDFVAKFVISEDLKAQSTAKRATFLSDLKGSICADDRVPIEVLTCARDILLAASNTEPHDRDPCSLRILAADMMDDILNRIFSPSSGALLLSGQAEVDLAVLILVDMYHFDPLRTIEAVFRVHLLPGADINAKVLVLRTCEAVVREDVHGMLPTWSPPTFALVPATARLLRDTFVVQAHATIPSSSAGKPSPVRQAQPRLSEELVARDESMSLIARLWMLDSRFLTQGLYVPPTNAPSNQPGSDDTLSRVCLASSYLLRHSQSPGLRKAITTLLASVYERQGDNTLHSLDKQLSALSATSAICAYAIESWHFPEETDMAFRLVVSDLQQHRLLLLSLPTNIIVALAVSSQLSAMYTSLQIAVLLGLTNPHTRQTTKECLKVVPLIAAFLDSNGRVQVSTPSPPMLPSALRFLRALAYDVDKIDLAAAASRVSSSGAVAAWSEMCRRQQELSHRLLRIPAQGNDPISSMKNESNFQRAELRQECTLLTNAILELAETVLTATVVGHSSDSLPVRFNDSTLPARHFENVLSVAARALFEMDGSIREAFQDSLAERLHPTHIPDLISAFIAMQHHFAGNESSFQIAILTLLKVLELVLNGSRTSDSAALLDRSSILSFVLSSFTRFRHSDSMLEHQLLVTASQVVADVAAVFSGIDFDLRVQLLEELLRRRDEFQGETEQYEALSSTSQALAALLLDTRALSSEQTNRFAMSLKRMLTSTHEKLDQEDNPMSLGLLQRARGYLVEALSRLVASRGASITSLDLQTELDIWCSVSKCALPLSTRTADPPEHRLARLVQQSPALAVAMSHIVSPGKYDELVETLIQVLGTRQAMSSFLRTIIQEEVENTEHEATLFRGNSFATRLMTVYARAKGYAYLRRTLESLILQLCQDPAYFTEDFEHPRGPEDEGRMSSELERVTEAFLHAIAGSVPLIPPEIRDICLHVAEAVGAKFPESVFTSIGGFMFLRFINPAIISPETIDVPLPTNSSAETRDVRKNLVMISKILQSLSNNVRFGLKDPSMRKLNDFMDIQVYTMATFLQRVSQPCPMFEYATAMVNRELAGEAVDLLRHLVQADADRIYAELQSMARAGPLFSSRLSKVADKFNDTLIQLQAHAASQRNEDSRMTPDDRLEAFVTRIERRGYAHASDWEHIFYETAANKQRTPTWCLALSLLEPDTVDLDSLAAVVISTLSLRDVPYELLVDATGFQRHQEIETSRVQRWISMLSASSLDLMSKVTVVTPTSAFRDFVNKISRVSTTDPGFLRKISFETDWRLLDARYYNIDVILPTRSVELYREPRRPLTPPSQLFEVSDARPDVPVSITLGPTSLSVKTERALTLLGECAIDLADFISLQDIEQIARRRSGQSTQIFLRTHSDQQTRCFRCDESTVAETVIELLHAACNLARDDDVSAKRHRTAESQLSRAIVQCLRGLSSETLPLRRSAYAVLGVLTSDSDGVETTTITPSLSLSAVTNASEQMAVVHSGEALPVLLQMADVAVHEASSYERHILIHAMRPWAYHLGHVQNASRELRTRVLGDFRRLIDLWLLASVRSDADLVALCSRIWPVLGKLDSVIPLIVDHAIEFALCSIPQAQAEKAVCSSLLAMNAISALRPKLLVRIRQLLARTALRPPRNGLSSAAEWPEISLLVRIDAELSFKDNIQLVLPDLFFVASTVVGDGGHDTRMATRIVVINAVHTLLRAGTAKDSDAASRMLRELSDSDSCFGIGLSASSQLPSWDALTNGTAFVKLLVDLLDAVAPCADTANAWRARWTSLVMTMCFQHNPAVQERQFISLSFLGALAIDSDLAYQIITSLRSALLASAEQGQEQPSQLVLVILRALVTTLPAMVDDTQFWPALAYVAISLLQIGWPRLDAAAVPLLTVIFESMDRNGFLDGNCAGDVVNDWRAEVDDAAEVFDRLDSSGGVSFKVNFAFSLALVLTSATREKATRSSTTTLLQQLIKYSKTKVGETISAAAWPFFILLLLGSTNMREATIAILGVVGLDVADSNGLSGHRLYDRLASETVIDDAQHATLAIAFLLKLGRDLTIDTELVASRPLHDLVRRALASQNLDVLSTVDKLVPLVRALPTDLSAVQGQGNDTLVNLGFASLTSTWDDEALLQDGQTSHERVELVCDLLGFVLDRPL